MEVLEEAKAEKGAGRDRGKHRWERLCWPQPRLPVALSRCGRREEKRPRAQLTACWLNAQETHSSFNFACLLFQLGAFVLLPWHQCSLVFVDASLKIWTQTVVSEMILADKPLLIAAKWLCDYCNNTAVATEINCKVITTKLKSPLQRKLRRALLWRTTFLAVGSKPVPPDPRSYRASYSSPALHFCRSVHASNHFRNREGLILETYLAWGQMVILSYQEPKGDFLKSSCSLQPLPLMLKYKPRRPQLPRNLFCRNNMPAWAWLRYLTANPSFQKIPLGRRIFSMTRALEPVATWHRRKLYNGQSLNWSRDLF